MFGHSWGRKKTTNHLTVRETIVKLSELKVGDIALATDNPSTAKRRPNYDVVEVEILNLTDWQQGWYADNPVDPELGETVYHGRRIADATPGMKKHARHAALVRVRAVQGGKDLSSRSRLFTLGNLLVVNARDIIAVGENALAEREAALAAATAAEQERSKQTAAHWQNLHRLGLTGVLGFRDASQEGKLVELLDGIRAETVNGSTTGADPAASLKNIQGLLDAFANPEGGRA